ncbi:MAG: hypothetical protein E5W15_08100 [Mesorhizobium sp.]|uniref:PAN domain-containing protein n=1 Tax=Mesorhizobium sp. TaxID=1871066 RepID=UPI000FE5D1F7|nr:PAN domain-containing protein [Mesorhizobium sp.]RWB40286.1 MAG: hypothetical protein EOQ46_25100 [Mesorhizobium sp.]RWB57904.1 MAG: hypothetical protein EOQ48_24230 [Mesorhizobium sp.]RWB82129.1 MAG: hypothetical protein EOQ51_24750 [Mesorhizobium sp.]RWD75810.1 MAG: hypothetical protein EOS60_06810 [Mesorhizobium sp.]TIU73377.1 MAG: hypothetical protein E5W15_08100 [Mesorhizobium sp.]
MLVRHNTALLEQAVGLVVKRSAIPTLQAEAAAQEKVAKAAAFRRMATGGAIAVAAIGIGLGLKLGLWQKPQLPPTPISIPRTEIPAQPAEKKADRPTVPVPTPRPTQVPIPPSPPNDPDVVTVDFTKFANKTVDFQGDKWELISGHHFKDEKDSSWDTAWCYSRRVVGGVDLNVELVNRLGPETKPISPISTPETLAQVGLTDATAKQLATNCAWLDRRTFAAADFATDPRREVGALSPQPSVMTTGPDPDSGFVVVSGWDAIGNDLPNMPIRGVTAEQCQSACDRDFTCLAVTYNTKYQACFMKGDASILVKSEDSLMLAKKVVESNLHYSNLVFANKTEVSGNPYWSGQLRYPDCILQCANEKSCMGFNFRSKEMSCTLLSSVSQSSDNSAVASGIKSVGN